MFSGRPASFGRQAQGQEKGDGLKLLSLAIRLALGNILKFMNSCHISIILWTPQEFKKNKSLL